MSTDEVQAPDAGATVPPRLVVGSIAALWLFYFLLTSVRSLIQDFSFQDEMLWRRALVMLVGAAMTAIVWLILRLFDSRPLWTKILAALLVAMPATIPIAQANQWVFSDIREKEEARQAREQGFVLRRDSAGNMLVDIPVEKLENLPAGLVLDRSGASATVLLEPAPTSRDRWREIVDIALARYFVILAWAAFYIALLAGTQAREAQRREERFRSAAKAAELRSLRYQVNPHFLFNALNSLSALVMTGRPDKAERMIQSLSRFYRRSLAEDTSADVTLAEEFDLQRQYLEIEKVRFPERLKTRYELPEALADCLVPGMILQPLVENSVKYGVSASAAPVTVTFAAREEYGRLVVTVADDAAPRGKLRKRTSSGGGFGIGLANVRDRLAARFGAEASLVPGPLDSGGYETEIRIPIARHG
ncbi:sensor histidine kinase [Qipengyuania sediminis]|uniref:sensor histidine kinase n=1 Tax=Qipengyuania sediminis TaxID=1532023 RepID=UPI001059F26C|nr:histidine kinase [Qipengyuania sediminis]